MLAEGGGRSHGRWASAGDEASHPMTARGGVRQRRPLRADPVGAKTSRRHEELTDRTETVIDHEELIHGPY
jgi:hypothetical protein